MIDQHEFLTRYIEPFENLSWVYEEGRGFVVWRLGTGANVELLHITAATMRQGDGRWLFHQMLDRLQDEPPYHSVYGFSLTSNARAHAFYQAMGFSCQTVEGIYKDGQAVLFWQSFVELQKKNGYWRKRPCSKHAGQFDLECPVCNAKNAEWIAN